MRKDDRVFLPEVTLNELAQKAVETCNHIGMDIAAFLQPADRCPQYLHHCRDVVMIPKEVAGAIHTTWLRQAQNRPKVHGHKSHRFSRRPRRAAENSRSGPEMFSSDRAHPEHRGNIAPMTARASRHIVCSLNARRRGQSMAHVDVWWHRHWVRVTERALAHTAAIVVGFVMMVVGLGLGVTIIMLPAGLVIGLLGAAIFVGGLFARIGDK
jgi:hypothetical protein